MTGRERYLTALENKKPDYLPCQVHNWMTYYLRNHMKCISDIKAYRMVGIDPVLYRGPIYIYKFKDLGNWQRKIIKLGVDDSGSSRWIKEITTPKGKLITKYAQNKFTKWITEQPIKNEQDFEIWNEYVPLPAKVNWLPVTLTKKYIGDKGIVRGSLFDFGQGSPWQSFCGFLQNAEQSIYKCFDDPDWMHYALKSMLDKKLQVLDISGKVEFDLVETGGGAGSSTLISPDMHKEFCLPYDKIQHNILKQMDVKVVYHLCGGLMPLLETIVENGADALETMTPSTMGGDCIMAEANKRVGDKLCFIGGFDQNLGFEKGTRKYIEESVGQLFEATKDNGGFICSPSDHFFFGDIDNLKYFGEVCKSHKY